MVDLSPLYVDFLQDSVLDSLWVIYYRTPLLLKLGGSASSSSFVYMRYKYANVPRHQTFWIFAEKKLVYYMFLAMEKVRESLIFVVTLLFVHSLAIKNVKFLKMLRTWHSGRIRI